MENTIVENKNSPTDNKITDEDCKIIIGQTNCSLETATQMFSRFGNTIDAILCILEGDEQYRKNEEIPEKKINLNLDKKSRVDLENIDKLRVMVDDKDRIYEELIHQ